MLKEGTARGKTCPISGGVFWCEYMSCGVRLVSYRCTASHLINYSRSDKQKPQTYKQSIVVLVTYLLRHPASRRPCARISGPVVAHRGRVPVVRMVLCSAGCGDDGPRSFDVRACPVTPLPLRGFWPSRGHCGA